MRPFLRLAALCLLVPLAPSLARAQETWPDLSAPPKASGGGEKDAAVIVGAENYIQVAKVPGARANAVDWQAYLTGTLKVPADKVALLRDNDATLEKMRKYASRAAAQAQAGGTLWFVFIGHGAPSKDGKDGLLIGADAQADADGMYARSLPRAELIALLDKGAQARTVVVIDACFSGRSASGESLVAGLQPLIPMQDQSTRYDPRTILMTAAKSDQFAGPLPKARRPRPAFSYLALGALRGWAADAQGRVTASAVVEFARRALSLDKGRTQTPELTSGAADALLGLGRESGPDLAKLDRDAPPGPDFEMARLGEVPAANAPRPLDASGLDWQAIDVDALERYNLVFQKDKGESSPEEKSAAWRKLAADAPKFAELAGERAAQWDAYAAQRRAREEAQQERLDARDADWEKISRLLALVVVPEDDKRKYSVQFVNAYWEAPGLDPEMAKQLEPYAGAAPSFEALRKLALKKGVKSVNKLAAAVGMRVRELPDYRDFQAIYDANKSRSEWSASAEGKAVAAYLRRARLDAAQTAIVTRKSGRLLQYAVNGRIVTDNGIILSDLDTDPEYKAFIANALATNILSNPLAPELQSALDAFRAAKAAAK